MKRFLLIGLSIVLLCSGLPATSEPLHSGMANKHTFILGFYDQDVDAGIFSRKANGQSIAVDTDKLGIGEAKTDWTFEYRYRLTDKWVLSASVYNYNGGTSVFVSQEFEFDGVVFEAGAELKTSTDIDTYMFDALYEVYGSDRAQLLVGGGLHLFDISSSIKTRVFAGDENQTAARAGNDLLAPLPNLRLQGFYAFSPKWAVVTTLGWLSFNYDEYDGAFTYVNVRATYQIGKGFGAGLGYQYTDMDFTRTNDSGKAGIDAQLNGPSVYLAYRF